LFTRVKCTRDEQSSILVRPFRLGLPDTDWTFFGAILGGRNPWVNIASPVAIIPAGMEYVKY
jgi:hypothetical protein